ncbi:hypothetical protein Pcinc_032181, partial [Petrolisthes cinctipes]
SRIPIGSGVHAAFPSTTPTRYTSADLARPSSSRQRQQQYRNRDEEEDLLPTVGERDNEVNSNSISSLQRLADLVVPMREEPSPPLPPQQQPPRSPPPRRYSTRWSRNTGRSTGRTDVGGSPGQWAEWAACSKTCGIGEQMRTRAVIHPSRRGGRPCPPLKETKWCGSSRDCDHKYFDW